MKVWLVGVGGHDRVREGDEGGLGEEAKQQQGDGPAMGTWMRGGEDDQPGDDRLACAKLD